jgi:hypothetical protein
MPAKAELKSGFWLGLGLALAFLALGMLQVLILRAIARRNG